MNTHAFQEKILSWYAEHRRDLPWRRTADPYAIIVSEVMLQQTQVDRVVPYYERWLSRFPDFSSLSSASPSEVLSLWSGLGYNSRGLRLQKLASVVVEKYGGKLPASYDALLSLPGIGPYTAGAVMAFAFNEPAPVIDTNVRRVLIHELSLPGDISPSELSSVAVSCIPPGKSRLWHNALMDYGALFATARATGVKPLSKQSRFDGSSRQVRGAVVRMLVAEGKVPYGRVKKAFDRADLDDILSKMEKDGVVVREGKTLRLP